MGDTKKNHSSFSFARGTCRQEASKLEGLVASAYRGYCPHNDKSDDCKSLLPQTSSPDPNIKGPIAVRPNFTQDFLVASIASLQGASVAPPTNLTRERTCLKFFMSSGLSGRSTFAKMNMDCGGSEFGFPIWSGNFGSPGIALDHLS